MSNQRIGEGRNFPPQIMGGEPREDYAEVARLILDHPNYEKLKQLGNRKDSFTLEQYAAYCLERSEDNYTNETQKEAQNQFERYWAFLNGA